MVPCANSMGGAEFWGGSSASFSSKSPPRGMHQGSRLSRKQGLRFEGGLFQNGKPLECASLAALAGWKRHAAAATPAATMRPRYPSRLEFVCEYETAFLQAVSWMDGLGAYRENTLDALVLCLDIGRWEEILPKELHSCGIETDGSRPGAWKACENVE